MPPFPLGGIGARSSKRLAVERMIKGCAMQNVLTFLVQLAIATGLVWLLALAIRSYFHKKAEKTGDFGITRLPDHPDDRPK